MDQVVGYDTQRREIQPRNFRSALGRIVFLAPNLQDVLLALSLSNVGIYAMRQLSPESNVRSIAQFEVKLYVERIELAPM